jgi:hypothetical protein
LHSQFDTGRRLDDVGQRLDRLEAARTALRSVS